MPQFDRGYGVCEVVIGFDDLVIDREGIVAVLGYRDRAIPDHFGELLDCALAQAMALSVIRAGYRLVQAGRTEGRNDVFVMGGTRFSTQKIVTGALGRADRAAVFTCTIGPALEAWARSTMQDDPVLGYIADAVGSAVAEAVADRLHDHIGAQMARHGWRITNRYSPGYCNWSVAEQHRLFALLPPRFCGISLGESALMLPVKSVSGIIGVGAAVKHADYLCEVCGVRDCTYRRYRERRGNALTTDCTDWHGSEGPESVRIREIRGLSS